MPGTFRQRLNMFATRHCPSDESNIFIYSLPRSGSTWLMELILTQPGFMSCDEPLNLRKAAVQENLGITQWSELHEPESKAKLHEYFSGLCSGRIRDPRFGYPTPLSRFYRPITRRIVFKMIDAGEEHINWLAQTFNGRVLFLLRHPIPVALSREVFPKLDSILQTSFRSFFTETQLRFAARIIKSGNKLARGVLDWCLRNSVALRSRNKQWAVITYEQLVVDPCAVIDHVSEKLSLPRSDLMHARLSVPSKSTALSNPYTRKLLQSIRDVNDQKCLVEKWRNEITESDLTMADEIVTMFGMCDAYRVTSTIPEPSYWIAK